MVKNKFEVFDEDSSIWKPGYLKLVKGIILNAVNNQFEGNDKFRNYNEYINFIKKFKKYQIKKEVSEVCKLIKANAVYPV